MIIQDFPGCMLKYATMSNSTSNQTMPRENQSKNLPPKEEVITTIHPVMVLTGRDNFEEWSYVVHSRLDLHGVVDLI